MEMNPGMTPPSNTPNPPDSPDTSHASETPTRSGQPSQGQPPFGQTSYGQPPSPYGQPLYGGQAPYPPYGASPYAQQPPPPPLPGSSSRWGPSSLGIDPAVAAGLGYLFPILAIVWFFIEKTNRYVKFNAAQAILLLIVYTVGAIIATVLLVPTTIALALGSNGGSGVAAAIGIILALGIALMAVVGVGYLVLHIWGIIAGFTGRYTKFPVIGSIAEKWAGGPAVPLYP
jgi:uncharacterized membrane protein